MSEPHAKRRKIGNEPSPSSSDPAWAEGEGEEAAYADWTIVVESEPDDSGSSSSTLKRTFLVHRVMIGPKCSYFDAAFSGAFQEESQRITKLQFPRDVVEHFHLFLDYCYDPIFDDDLRETNIIETMTLFVLADYFGAPQLESSGREALETFCTHDLYLAEIYTVSSTMRVDTVRSILVHKCAKEPAIIVDNKEFMMAVNAEFIIDVLKDAGKFISQVAFLF